MSGQKTAVAAAPSPQPLLRFLVPKSSTAPAATEPPGAAEPTPSYRGQARAEGEEPGLSDAARAVLLYAAAYGLDTRLGIACFSARTDPGGDALVLLDLHRLGKAVQACAAPEHRARYEAAVAQLALERQLPAPEGKGKPTKRQAAPSKRAAATLALAPRELHELRRCAAAADLPPLAEGRQPHALMRRLQEQDALLPAGEPAWGRPLLRDQPAARESLPAFVAALTGAEAAPLLFHVRAGLKPTEQRLRSAREYAEDLEQVGRAVEELEVLVEDAYVPRPPALGPPLPPPTA